MKSRFSNTVEKKLRVAGWFPGRNVGEEYLARLNKQRPLFAAARHVLDEFAGLFVSEMENADAIGARGLLCFDPIEGLIDHGPASAWDDEERGFGCRVYPLGFKDYFIFLWKNERRLSGQDFLILDERGRIFLVDYGYVLVGDSIDIAIENLILGSGMRQWDVAEDRPLIL